LFVGPEDHELLEKVQDIADLCETLPNPTYEKKYATAILTLVQYFVGLDDGIESIIINAENDRGKKYVIKIIQ
jgi:hypothetical protein